MDPPETLVLRFCPTCGQNDARKTIGKNVHVIPGTGTWCYTKPLEIVYSQEKHGI